MAGETIPITLYLDSATKQELDRLKVHGFTLNGFIRAAITEHLKRVPPPIDPENLSRLVSHS